MAAALVWGLSGALVQAREPHRPHRPHAPRAPRQPNPPDDGGAAPTNVHFDEQGSIALPGRGLALAWSPDGTRIAAGGRFREKATGLRYDTRVADVAAQSLVKSFACHWFYVVATTWTQNPYLGEVLADGGGDHAVKMWNPAAPGSTSCRPGQFLPSDGAMRALGEVNGWTTWLAFSPDGRFLAGASRDRMIRVWQVAPGPTQFRVVAALYDPDAGNFTALAWQADGTGLVTGDRHGRIVAWDLDPDADRWDDATIADFAGTSYEGQPGWCGQHAALTQKTPRWIDDGHRWIWTVDVAPAGDRVAAAGADGTVSVLDVATGAVAYRATTARGTAFHGLDWSPDGTLIAAGAADHAIYLFDAATGAIYDRLVGHDDLVSAVAWSPDGRLLASTAGGPRISLALLNVTTGPDLSIRLWARR